MLKFRLFGLPVEVKASFLLIAALIGFSSGLDDRIWWTFAWVGVVFVSILIHELGHAFAARRYSAAVEIEVNGLGGLTRWSVPSGELTPGRRAFIAAAGSAVGVIVGGIVLLATSPLTISSPFLAFVVESFIVVNVFWGLVNWLPIRPLDGGHLLMSLLERFAPQRGDRIASFVFTVTAAGALGFAVWRGFIFIAVLAAWMLFSEFAVRAPRIASSQPPPGMPTLTYDDGEGDEAHPHPLDPPSGDPPSGHSN